jgi:N-acetyltransferase 10
MSAREIDKIFRPYNTLERSPRFEDDTLACSFKCQYPLDSLIKECFNFEQAKVLLILLDKIVGKEFGQFTSLVGARGRGKSASLGLAIAGALVQGIINIIISAPALENTQIFFKFVIKGLQSTHLFEHTDYEVIKITNAFSNYKSVVQIKLLKKNHPSIRYLSPVSYPVTKQVELLVIEETSEIPQTLIERMLGSYPVFASFTQKIFEEHVRYSIQRHKRKAKKKGEFEHKIKHIKLYLTTPIRYSSSDMVELWINQLFCLDVTNYTPPIPLEIPQPSQCELFYINIDTLFSYTKESETLLQMIASLYFVARRKHTPNDIFIMTEKHFSHLFVLLPPQTSHYILKTKTLLCALHVLLDGVVAQKKISPRTQKKYLRKKQFITPEY